MRYYILKTEPKRHSRKLLVSYKTFKERTSTVARWLKQILDRSGIDSKHFTAHCFRGASSSAAYAQGVQLSEIMEIANWATAKTFYTYYHKEATCNFSNSVLNSTTCNLF
jgi:integrase